MTAPSAEVFELAERVKALSPGDALRLAADLLDRDQVRQAHAVARPVVERLGLALALARLREATT